jgi:REP-associated tyrosine transposase
VGRRGREPFDRAFVHAYTRGNNRGPVFLDEFDYSAWLRLLDRTVKRFEWICHAYCLMPNHYHLLLEVSQARLSAGMRHLNGAFAQRVNLRYAWSGHVFEGPYRVELVESQAHLLELCRYIPLNPVRARIRPHAADWPLSSYRATAGLEHVPPLLTVSLVRSLFGRGLPAIARYREFVADGALSDTSRADTARDLVPRHGAWRR